MLPSPSTNPPAEAFDYSAALQGCAAGQRDALRRLFDREAGQLLGVAQRIVRRPDLADEVVQDAFLQIWQKAGSFDPARGNGRGWIYAVVRNAALNLVRHRAYETGFADGAMDALVDPDPDALSRLADEGDALALQRCLSRLDEGRRQVVLLAFVAGLTHVQIAARLGQPLGTIKAWVRRSLLALKECLS